MSNIRGGLEQGDKIRLRYKSKQTEEEKERTGHIKGVYGNPPKMGFYDVDIDDGSEWDVYEDKIRIVSQKFGPKIIGWPIDMEYIEE